MKLSNKDLANYMPQSGKRKVTFEDLVEFGVASTKNTTYIIQIHDSYNDFDGWDDSDLLKSGFKLLAATFKERARATDKGKPIQKVGKFNWGVKTVSKIRLYPKMYQCDNGAGTLVDMYNEFQTLNELLIFSAAVTQYKNLEFINLLMQSEDSNQDKYHWVNTGVGSTKVKGLEYKMILTHVNGHTIKTIMTSNKFKDLKNRVLTSIKKIALETFCEINKEDIKIIKTNTVCNGLL